MLKLSPLLFFLALLMSSCSPAKMIQTEIYFGLSDRKGEISDSTWNTFKYDNLEETLDGYTEIDCKGYWKNEKGEKYRENSKLIIYIHEKSKEEEVKINAIVNEYKAICNQESVLVVDKKVVVNFK